MSVEEVKQLMSSATSANDWNNKCDIVKKKCGGYPAFWWNEIMVSGLYNRVKATW